MNDCEVLVTGCFNILHAGHCKLLEFAHEFGAVTVGINADWYLNEKYNGVFVPLMQRAYVLKCNKYVSNVVMFKEANPINLIYKLRPETYVRGPDYSGKELIEMDALIDTKSKLIIHQADKIQNSSSLVKSFDQIPILDNFSEGIIDF